MVNRRRFNGRRFNGRRFNAEIIQRHFGRGKVHCRLGNRRRIQIGGKFRHFGRIQHRRNFFNRIATATPVLDPALKARVIREGLELALADTAKAWQMDGDGSYHRIRPADGQAPAGVQETLLAEYAC